MKKSIFCILILCIMLSLFSTEGKYERKSVSSVESIWIGPNAFKGVNTFPYEFYEKMIDFYIELPRFDFNEIPEPLLEDFRDQANALNVITPDALSEVLNQTIGQKIKEILEDPKIQTGRISNFKDEAWDATFAGSKGKSMGLTVEEIERLMNSAFIYLPYISKYELTKDGDEIFVEITGGIIWYQVKISPEGKIDLQLRIASETYTQGFADKNPKQTMGMKADYKHYHWGNEVYSVSEELYAQYDAIQALAKNLSVKTKQISEFNITGQIVETLPGRKYSASIGRKEGLYLDDGYFLVENYENEEGEINAKTVGFVRVVKTADNINHPEELTVFKQFIGPKIGVGSTLREHPRLGIDFRFVAGYQTGMDIPKEYTNFLEFSGPKQLLKEDAKDQIFAGIEFAYNLAPIVGVSQTFFELESTFGIPIVSYEEDVTNSFVYTFGAYGGLSKKFWFFRNSLNVNAKFGYDRLVMSGDYIAFDYKYTINAWGLKGGLAYNYMITPDLLLHLGADYKLGFKPTGLTLEFKDETLIDVNSGFIASKYPDLRLGGIMFNAGISYSFGELPFNLFGWLDPLKKY